MQFANASEIKARVRCEETVRQLLASQGFILRFQDGTLGWLRYHYSEGDLTIHFADGSRLDFDQAVLRFGDLAAEEMGAGN